MRRLFLLSRQNTQENPSNHKDASIASDSICDTDTDSLKQWIDDFNPRSKVETVRNCVTISDDIKSHVVQTVFSALLACEGGVEKLGQDGRH